MPLKTYRFQNIQTQTEKKNFQMAGKSTLCKYLAGGGGEKPGPVF